jgi:hypothetical protein
VRPHTHADHRRSCRRWRSRRMRASPAPPCTRRRIFRAQRDWRPPRGCNHTQTRMLHTCRPRARLRPWHSHTAHEQAGDYKVSSCGDHDSPSPGKKRMEEPFPVGERALFRLLGRSTPPRCGAK